MEPQSKKQKTDENNEIKFGTKFPNLKNFEIVRVLNSSDENCRIVVEGKLKEEEHKAIIELQKLPFDENKLPEILGSNGSLRKLFENDVYHNLMFSIPPELNEVKALVIYPAEEKHLKKYEKQFSSFIQETPEMFEKVTRPFIESSSYSKQWIYNILEHKKETDRIICEDLDPTLGFILVPDMKWTGEQIENLYVQALVMDRSISCIRDLRGHHLDLLNNIYNKCTKSILEKYGLPAHKLRVYFHYQPSYYHLHVHFSALSFDAPGTWAGKAILLQDVISNLELDSEFYSKSTISYTLKDNHPLMDKIKEFGYFESRENNK